MLVNLTLLGDAGHADTSASWHLPDTIHQTTLLGPDSFVPQHQWMQEDEVSVQDW